MMLYVCTVDVVVVVGFCVFCFDEMKYGNRRQLNLKMKKKNRSLNEKISYDVVTYPTQNPMTAHRQRWQQQPPLGVAFSPAGYVSYIRSTYEDNIISVRCMCVCVHVNWRLLLCDRRVCNSQNECQVLLDGTLPPPRSSWNDNMAYCNVCLAYTSYLACPDLASCAGR